MLIAVNKTLNYFSNSSCRRPALLWRRKPSSCTLVWLRHGCDSQVSPLCPVLKGCFGQGSTCDPGKLPRWHVWRRKWRSRRRMWWSLRCLRELLLLLPSGGYNSCRRSCLIGVCCLVMIRQYAVYF